MVVSINVGYLYGTQVYREAICKVISCLAHAILKDVEMVAALPNARRFIVAWGLRRGDTLAIMRFPAEDSFMNFANPTDYSNSHIGRLRRQ